MRQRIVIAVLLAFSVASMPAVARPPAALAASRTTLLRERLLLLEGYLERYANEHYSYYPARAAVHKGGSIPAPVWPRNPWTGAAMKQSTSAGDFTYRPSTNLLSYKLVGYYPGGSVTLARAIPYNRKMQNDHRTREQLELVRQLVQQWARAHRGLYPPASEVAADGAVGLQDGIKYWPHNVWTHQPMAISSSWGDFSYRVSAARDSFSLVAHFSRGGSLTLGGDIATSPWRQALLALQDEIASRNGAVLEGFAREWALVHAGSLPATEELAPSGAVAAAHATWPVDPYSDEPVSQGERPGQFAYVAGPGLQYAIVLHLSDSDATITGTAPSLP